MTNEELTELLTAYVKKVEELIREKGYHRGTVLHTLATHSSALLLDQLKKEPPEDAPES